MKLFIVSKGKKLCIYIIWFMAIKTHKMYSTSALRTTNRTQNCFINFLNLASHNKSAFFGENDSVSHVQGEWRVVLIYVGAQLFTVAIHSPECATFSCFYFFSLLAMLIHFIKVKCRIFRRSKYLNSLHLYN